MQEWLSQIPEWLRLILSGSFGGIVVVIIGAILKRGINHKFDKALEHHKAELSRENEAMRQQSSHTLELARLERQIRYSGTYEKILNAIIQIYEKLIDSHISAINYVDSFEMTGPSQEERRRILDEQVNDFQRLYSTKRLFLPEELDKEIIGYINYVDSRADLYRKLFEQQIYEARTQEQREHIDKLIRMKEDIENKWGTTLRSIRQQFRDILGVEPNLEADKEYDIKSTEMGEET